MKNISPKLTTWNFNFQVNRHHCVSFPSSLCLCFIFFENDHASPPIFILMRISYGTLNCRNVHAIDSSTGYLEKRCLYNQKVFRNKKQTSFKKTYLEYLSVEYTLNPMVLSFQNQIEKMVIASHKNKNDSLMKNALT